MAWGVVQQRLKARREREISKTRITRPELIGAIGGRRRSKVARRSAREDRVLMKRKRLDVQRTRVMKKVPRRVQAGPTAKMPATPRVDKAVSQVSRPPVMGTPAGLEKKIRIFQEIFLR